MVDKKWPEYLFIEILLKILILWNICLRFEYFSGEKQTINGHIFSLDYPPIFMRSPSWVAASSFHPKSVQ